MRYCSPTGFAWRAGQRTRAWPPARRRKAQQFQSRAQGSRTGGACRTSIRKRAREDVLAGMARGYRPTLNMVRALLASALLALPAAARTPLHTWTDNDGVLHVEDVPPPPRARSAPRKAAPAAQVSIPAPKRGGPSGERGAPSPPGAPCTA